MNYEELASACTRIFEDKSIVRYKTILINPEKIFELPVLSKELDIQYCNFFTEDNGSKVWQDEIIDNGKPYFIF